MKPKTVPAIHISVTLPVNEAAMLLTFLYLITSNRIQEAMELAIEAAEFRFDNNRYEKKTL